MSTLGSFDPIILEGVESYCDNYESGFGEVMTLIFNWIMLHMIVILLSLLPPLLMRRNLLMWRVISFLCLCVMKRMLYVMVILLNFFMMLLKIIMREDHMLLHIAIISSFLSMCLKF